VFIRRKRERGREMEAGELLPASSGSGETTPPMPVHHHHHLLFSVIFILAGEFEVEGLKTLDRGSIGGMEVIPTWFDG
jgi:hypothetical protein